MFLSEAKQWRGVYPREKGDWTEGVGTLPLWDQVRVRTPGVGVCTYHRVDSVLRGALHAAGKRGRPSSLCLLCCWSPNTFHLRNKSSDALAGSAALSEACGQSSSLPPLTSQSRPPVRSGPVGTELRAALHTHGKKKTFFPTFPCIPVPQGTSHTAPQLSQVSPVTGPLHVLSRPRRRFLLPWVRLTSAHPCAQLSLHCLRKRKAPGPRFCANMKSVLE